LACPTVGACKTFRRPGILRTQSRMPASSPATSEHTGEQRGEAAMPTDCGAKDGANLFGVSSPAERTPASAGAASERAAEREWPGGCREIANRVRDGMSAASAPLGCARGRLGETSPGRHEGYIMRSRAPVWTGAETRAVSAASSWDATWAVSRVCVSKDCLKRADSRAKQQTAQDSAALRKDMFDAVSLIVNITSHGKIHKHQQPQQASTDVFLPLHIGRGLQTIHPAIQRTEPDASAFRMQVSLTRLLLHVSSTLAFAIEENITQQAFRCAAVSTVSGGEWTWPCRMAMC
jgi:hypothetical protein